MTDEELAAIEQRHQHDHAEDGGTACPSCEEDVPALLAEVRRLRDERRDEQEALEELLEARFRFVKRGTFEMNVVYSIEQVMNELRRLREDEQRFLKARELYETIATARDEIEALKRRCDANGIYE